MAGYIERLKANCERALVAEPERVFILKNLEELWGLREGIYIFRQLSGSPGETFDRFLNFKSHNSRKCPKANAPNWTMYVGSSTTGLKKRIAQHLGKGPEGTYALHLEFWFEEAYEIEIKIYNETREVLQIIEDDLSEELKPAFGKQGGNNK